MEALQINKKYNQKMHNYLASFHFLQRVHRQHRISVMNLNCRIVHKIFWTTEVSMRCEEFMFWSNFSFRGIIKISLSEDVIDFILWFLGIVINLFLKGVQPTVLIQKMK